MIGQQWFALTGLSRTGKRHGKTKIFQGQGILYEVKENSKFYLKVKERKGILFLASLKVWET